MQKIEVLVVGHGIAGMCLSFSLTQYNIAHIVIDPGGMNASKIAAGVYNPIVLKRFNPIWKAEEMQRESQVFFKKFEDFHSVTVDQKLPVIRRFAHQDEVVTWSNKCQLAPLKAFLNPLALSNPYAGIHADSG
ncbi:MAG: hypothetical protein RQ756_07190, partial [Flavobacteriaceae bacterium]|nr:hypothetical protein [Flavobacteriaceae bacterium]